jgi:hypothetical protein
MSKRYADRGESLTAVYISASEYAAAVRDNNVGDTLQWMIANPHAWHEQGDKRFERVPSITFEGVSIYIQRDAALLSIAETYQPFDDRPARWVTHIYPLNR